MVQLTPSISEHGLHGVLMVSHKACIRFESQNLTLVWPCHSASSSIHMTSQHVFQIHWKVCCLVHCFLIVLSQQYRFRKRSILLMQFVPILNCYPSYWEMCCSFYSYLSGTADNLSKWVDKWWGIYSTVQKEYYPMVH